MKKIEVALFSSFIGLLILLSFVTNINAESDENNTMTVSANIIGIRILPAMEGVGIQVPDFIDLGNVTNKTLISDEETVYINNTGTVNITVTPQLEDPNEGIFSFLFFRSYKTSSDPLKNQYSKIGDYSLYIDKPASGSKVRTGHCYMRLNLTDFDSPITQDLFGHEANIIFYAMPA